MKRILTIVAILALSSQISLWACTNFLVGKKASTDGSTIISYSADSYGMYGRLIYLPAGKHAPGSMRRIVDGDTNHYLGEIPEVPYTYKVVGNINEHQLSIMETTFGGRHELADPNGKIDYVSLMALGMQRAKTAREAIKVMTTLVQEYGYASEGESFSIADPNEVWIMEMIGKGPDRKGAVWVAVRIPDDCIAAHANQSRIHQFDLNDKDNVLYAEDVISFAREKGYYNGDDRDFSFADAYSPADFSSQRYCDARAWSFFNHWVDGMDKYLPFVDGMHIGQSVPVMPLYFKPKKKLSVQDVMNCMRDHYEGTPFDVTQDAGAGPFTSPYRTTPLSWEYDGKKYFNERPISTQQTSYTVVAQLRSFLPDPVGGILWFGNDDANMVAYTPVYCCTERIPECYADATANYHTFSWKSAFWVCNWVANMIYPRYSQMFPSLQKVRDELENSFFAAQNLIEKQAVALCNKSNKKAVKYLTDYTNQKAEDMMKRWKELGEYLIVKYNDQTILNEEDGKFTLTPDGVVKAPKRVGYDNAFRKVIIEQTGDKFLVPQE